MGLKDQISLSLSLSLSLCCVRVQQEGAMGKLEMSSHQAPILLAL